jgi:hypothetical protein
MADTTEQHHQGLPAEVSKAVADTKKPSEIVLEAPAMQRDTGRPTDLPNPDEVVTRRVLESGTICCCIDPYVNEEASVYVPGSYIREGDVYKHRTTMVRMVICFNVCYSTEYTTQTTVVRAADGATLNIEANELNDIAKFFLVKSEKCKHRHHDIRRYSVLGRTVKYLCTLQGIVSTLRKVTCIEDCVDTVNIRTVRCERSHYSRRNFK